MTGAVEIVNIALARLGESPIQSLDEGSVPANTARLLYAPVRRAALREYDWNFALTTASLARLTERGTDFHCAFALPSGCLRAVRLRGDARFEIRGGVLYTDSPTADLEYVADVDDESRFDPKFAEALSYKLASELAMPVRGSSELMSAFSNAYSAIARQAAAESARESRRKLPENPYLEARY